ncbi:MAG: precorrin-3B synthase, partial [Actinomycetota bacterium]|nr:precorrin-3B synthase [Actinomycetota bacterium]
MDADLPVSLAVSRTRADRCPGALALHTAADGMLCRIRLPGGELAPAALAGLAELSERFGEGGLELTSRGNVQIRAITAGDATLVTEAVADFGLLPSATHERVRNIVASPLAGLDGKGSRLTPIVRELDRRLCGRAVLAELPGRFLFGLDDGRGDMLALRPDAAAVAIDSARWHVLPADVEVGSGAVVEVLLATAEAFLAERSAQSSAAWRVAELPGGPESVGARVRRDLGLRATGSPRRPVLAGVAVPAEPVGPIRQADGRWAVIVLAPLGRLSAGQARLF